MNIQHTRQHTNLHVHKGRRDAVLDPAKRVLLLALSDVMEEKIDTSQGQQPKRQRRDKDEIQKWGNRNKQNHQQKVAINQDETKHKNEISERSEK
jgi:hypothetical protein